MTVPPASISAFESLEARRNRPWKGEEEVRVGWIKALEDATGKTFDAERARKDASYNDVIIEFKSPGLFKGTDTSPAFREAIDERLDPYIRRDATRTGLHLEDYFGIAIDGEHVAFAHFEDDSITYGPLLPINQATFSRVVEAIRGSQRRPVAYDELISEFGHRSRIGGVLMQSLSDQLATSLMAGEEAAPWERKTHMLFEEWRSLYGQITGISGVQQSEAVEHLSFTWKGDAALKMAASLFIIHTYNSILIKLLAAQIVAAHGLTGDPDPAGRISASFSDADLIEWMRRAIEEGATFKDAGIEGFVEEAIFSWYLDAASIGGRDICDGLREICISLTLFRTDRLDRSRDVLRDLYQGLVPRQMRKSLGEFYTPDWLVEFAMNQARGLDGWLNHRVLDPTCGSGAFLIAVMRRKRAEAEEKGMSPEAIIDHLCDQVWGFDLNPLAVQTSRVNVLMELVELLREAPGHRVELPVLLADAIYSPAEDPNEDVKIMSYRIGSKIADLHVKLPAELARDRAKLDRVFVSMGQSVEVEKNHADAWSLLLEGPLEGAPEEWRSPIMSTYEQVLDLHRRNWNGIWFRIVRNYFWSATAGKFDTVLGNPPWVRWSRLPELYRNRVKPICDGYDIFSDTRYHGGNELDISAMITYAVADKWLATGGRLAFLLTGTLFRNPSSAGFRRFDIGLEGAPLVPVAVHDFKTVAPFPDAANNTVLAIIDKRVPEGETYPVAWSTWTRPTRTRIQPTATYDEAMSLLNEEIMEAAPVGENGAPWSVMPVGKVMKAIEQLAGPSERYSGRKGITTDLNGAFFVSAKQASGGRVMIATRKGAGRKREITDRSAWIEEEFLHPLLKGAADFEDCYLKTGGPNGAEDPAVVILPNHGINKTDYEAARRRVAASPLATAWFQRYEALLADRATYKRQMAGAPIQAVYNVGDYTFAPWKVIWPEQSSKFTAAVAGMGRVPGLAQEMPFVPDHKIYYVPFNDRDEAMFLCGLLNAPEVRAWIDSHTVSIQVGDVFKHLELPAYDGSNEAHVALATSVISAHETHDASARHSILENVRAMASALLI